MDLFINKISEEEIVSCILREGKKLLKLFIFVMMGEVTDIFSFVFFYFFFPACSFFFFQD